MVTTAWQSQHLCLDWCVKLESGSDNKNKKKTNICWLRRIQKENPETNINRNDTQQLNIFLRQQLLFSAHLDFSFGPFPPSLYTTHLDSQCTHTCSPCPHVSAMLPFLRQQMSHVWRRLVDNDVADRNQHGTQWHRHKLDALTSFYKKQKSEIRPSEVYLWETLQQYWTNGPVLTQRHFTLKKKSICLHDINDSIWLRGLVNTFLVYMHRLGVLPGTGIPAFVSLMKYFWTLLATWNV